MSADPTAAPQAIELNIQQPAASSKSQSDQTPSPSEAKVQSDKPATDVKPTGDGKEGDKKEEEKVPFKALFRCVYVFFFRRFFFIYFILFYLLQLKTI